MAKNDAKRFVAFTTSTIGGTLAEAVKRLKEGEGEESLAEFWNVLDDVKDHLESALDGVVSAKKTLERDFGVK